MSNVTGWWIGVVGGALALGSAGCGGPKEAKVDDVNALPCKADTNKSIEAGKASRCLLSADVEVGPYVCEGGKMFSVYADGALKDCYLKAPVTLAGVTCKEGFALHEKGALRRCKTTAKATKDGIGIEPGNWVTLSPAGKVRRLETSVPQPMGAYSCQGNWNYFHENGALAQCELAQPADVGGKPRAAKERVCFDEKGGVLADCKALVIESFLR